MEGILKELSRPFEPKHVTPEEEWRVISGFEGRYEVSNFGRVRTYWHSKPRYLKGSINRGGYHVYDLHLDKHRSKCLAHRLVASAFLGNSSLDVNHMDGNKLNNFVGNLEYCTRAENIYHSHYTLGKQMGESHPQAKLSNGQVRDIRLLLAQGIRQRVIAKQFGVATSYISMIKNGHARKEAAL